MAKLICIILMSSNKPNFVFFYLFIFLLLLLDSSTKYYQDNKERVQKEACERCQSLSEEEKGKKAPKRSR